MALPLARDLSAPSAPYRNSGAENDIAFGRGVMFSMAIELIVNDNVFNRVEKRPYHLSRYDPCAVPEPRPCP